MFLRYDGCTAIPKLRPGMFAEFEKNATLGDLFNVNLKPTGDKKFLFCICVENAFPVAIFISI